MAEFPRAVVGAVTVNGKGELLLIKSPKWGNRWCVPGGGIEPEETIFSAAEREVKEETGISVRAQKVIGFGELVNHPQFHKKAHMVYFDVLCRPKAGKQREKAEASEVLKIAWAKPKQALRFRLSEPTRKSIINMLKGQGFK